MAVVVSSSTPHFLSRNADEDVAIITVAAFVLDTITVDDDEKPEMVVENNASNSATVIIINDAISTSLFRRGKDAPADTVDDDPAYRFLLFVMFMVAVILGVRRDTIDN